HRIFEEQCLRQPDRIAVKCDGEELRFSQLNERANQLAHMLIEQGVAPDTLVAICLERSLDMLVAILGVLKAGAGYLPIDPLYPEVRVRFMLEDSRDAHLITTEVLAKLFPCPI